MIHVTRGNDERVVFYFPNDLRDGTAQFQQPVEAAGADRYRHESYRRSAEMLHERKLDLERVFELVG